MSNKAFNTDIKLEDDNGRQFIEFRVERENGLISYLKLDYEAFKKLSKTKLKIIQDWLFN